MTRRKAYAHTLPGRGPENWELLEPHLAAVEQAAGEFAGALIPSAQNLHEWGRTLGRWHDLGKYSAAFQAMLLGANGVEAHLESAPDRVDHSTAGAQLANTSIPHGGAD